MGTSLAGRDGSSGRRGENQWLLRLFLARDRRCPSGERPGEAQLVAVRVGDVEEALAPRRVARRGIGPNPGGGQAGVEGIDIGVVEDQPAPPIPYIFRI